MTAPGHPRITPETEMRQGIDTLIRKHGAEAVLGYLTTVETTVFLREHGFDEVDAYLHFMDVHKIPIVRDNIKTRRKIEDYALDALERGQKGDMFFEKCGDADFITETTDYNQVGKDTLQKAYVDAMARGMEIRTIIGPDFKRDSFSRENANILLGLIGENALRYSLDKTHAIVRRLGDRTHAIVWYSKMKPGCERVDGKPQDPDKVVYTGFELGEPEAHKPFLSGLQNKLIKMWEAAKAVKPELDAPEMTAQL